jgi:hypothetical protein
VAEPYEIVWSEATRLLARQEASLDTLRVRALGVLSAGGLITGILGAQKGSATWATLVALTCLALSAGLTVWIQWPSRFDFSHDLAPMIQRIEVSGQEPLSSLDVTYNWARDLDENRKVNARKLRVLVNVYTCMCAFLGMEIVASVAAVALSR